MHTFFEKLLTLALLKWAPNMENQTIDTRQADQILISFIIKRLYHRRVQESDLYIELGRYFKVYEPNSETISLTLKNQDNLGSFELSPRTFKLMLKDNETDSFENIIVKLCTEKNMTPSFPIAELISIVDNYLQQFNTNPSCRALGQEIKLFCGNKTQLSIMDKLALFHMIKPHMKKDPKTDLCLRIGPLFLKLAWDVANLEADYAIYYKNDIDAVQSRICSNAQNFFLEHKRSPDVTGEEIPNNASASFQK